MHTSILQAQWARDAAAVPYAYTYTTGTVGSRCRCCAIRNVSILNVVAGALAAALAAALALAATLAAILALACVSFARKLVSGLFLVQGRLQCRRGAGWRRPGSRLRSRVRVRVWSLMLTHVRSGTRGTLLFGSPGVRSGRTFW